VAVAPKEVERPAKSGRFGRICYSVCPAPQLVACSAWSTRLLERTVRLDLRSRSNQENIMATGTIKRIVPERGFGFIAADDSKEYFFHRSALDGSLDFDQLRGGEKVEFVIETSDKGPRAGRVRAV
jgi:cold shock protein